MLDGQRDLAGKGWGGKAALTLLNLGVIGMTAALLSAGYEQSFLEYVLEGSTWLGY